MFGGMGGGRSPFRLIRIGLLVVFLIFAATLHDRGSAYNTLHVVYLVLVVALIGASIMMSRRSGNTGGRVRRRGGGTFGGPSSGPNAGRIGGGSLGTPPPPPHTHPIDPPDPEA